MLTEGIQNSEVGMADTKPCLALALFRVIWLWDTFVDFEISIVPRFSRLEEEEGGVPKTRSPYISSVPISLHF